jgi:hypothetical protein
MTEKDKVIHACLFRDTKPKTDGGDTNAQRAAFLNNVTWPDNHTIKVAFFKEPFKYEGAMEDPKYTLEKAKFVQEMVEKKLTPLINIKFEWDVPLDQSECRIMFVEARGAWSTLGTQSLDTSKNEPTMNLGWIDNDTDYDNEVYKGTGIVVLHEFGHLLGMIHEHSRSDVAFQWNKEVVYKQLGGKPNNWSKEDCDTQIFQAYQKSEFNGSEYDKDSMMHYFFPSSYFLADPGLKKITEMSETDKFWLSKKYPKSLNDKSVAESNDIEKPFNLFDIIWGSKLSKIITVLFIIALLVLLYYLLKPKKVVVITVSSQPIVPPIPVAVPVPPPIPVAVPVPPPIPVAVPVVHQK